MQNYQECLNLFLVFAEIQLCTIFCKTLNFLMSTEQNLVSVIDRIQYKKKASTAYREFLGSRNFGKRTLGRCVKFLLSPIYAISRTLNEDVN